MNLFPFLDATYLGSPANESELLSLCGSIKKAPHLVAGICVYPDQLSFVQRQLAGLPLDWITVINFPHGKSSLSQIQDEIKAALKLGATECDVVIPYPTFLQNFQIEPMAEFMRYCRQAIGSAKFKIILETGCLPDAAIYALSLAACEQGVDFIKTSTGKVKPAATLTATDCITNAIDDFYQAEGKKVGLKIAGGIHTPEQAQAYIDQLQSKLPEWLTPELFRIGASQLLNTLLLKH